jgi:RNA polymerase sigma-70 factor, ECF subfamily
MHEAVFSADRNSGAESLDKAAGGGRVRGPLYSFCRTAIPVCVSRRLCTASELLDAEDVVQETFLKIYRAGVWEEIKDENAFVAVRAWRIAINKLSRKGNERQNVATDLEIASTDTSPEGAAIAANSNAMVHRLIDALPEELRQPLAHSTVEELNSREIATMMGLTEVTVRTRLMRAREILKQKFGAIVEGRYEK